MLSWRARPASREEPRRLPGRPRAWRSPTQRTEQARSKVVAAPDRNVLETRCHACSQRPQWAGWKSSMGLPEGSSSRIWGPPTPVTMSLRKRRPAARTRATSAARSAHLALRTRRGRMKSSRPPRRNTRAQARGGEGSHFEGRVLRGHGPAWRRGGQFIHARPPVVLASGGRVEVLREAESVEGFVGRDRLPERLRPRHGTSG